MPPVVAVVPQAVAVVLPVAVAQAAAMVAATLARRLIVLRALALPADP
ncbi:hypothetical protein [Pleomorphomonas oryzae]|nr:hypothetical protein [Pleomorphomonas oryzae]